MASRIITVNKITPELILKACEEVEGKDEVIYLWSDLTYKIQGDAKSYYYCCISELQMKKETNFSESNIQVEKW
jgi:hypothetical protein